MESKRLVDGGNQQETMYLSMLYCDTDLFYKNDFSLILGSTEENSVLSAIGIARV
jgi:hypothetical protein